MVLRKVNSPSRDICEVDGRVMTCKLSEACTPIAILVGKAEAGAKLISIKLESASLPSSGKLMMVVYLAGKLMLSRAKN